MSKEIISDKLKKLVQKSASFYLSVPRELKEERSNLTKEFSQIIFDQLFEVKIDDQKKEVLKEFKDNPVFIGGFGKSGTTLLLGLLDYHPEIVSLVPDISFLRKILIWAEKFDKNNFFNHLAKSQLDKMLIDFEILPIFDLLSESDQIDFRKYSFFVSCLKKFIFKKNDKSGWLSSLAQSVFLVNGQADMGHRPKLWIDKNPLSEFHFERSLNYFSKSKLIYIARNPYDNLASVKKWLIRLGKKYNLISEIRSLEKSYNKANKLKEKYNDRVLIVKYEDLVLDSKKVLNDICLFLGIKYDKSLEKSTVFGRCRIPNSSNFDPRNKNNFKEGIIHKSFINKNRENLSDFEKYCIFKQMKKSAQFFDYKIKLEININFFKKILFFCKRLFNLGWLYFKILKNKTRYI